VGGELSHVRALVDVPSVGACMTGDIRGTMRSSLKWLAAAAMLCAAAGCEKRPSADGETLHNAGRQRGVHRVQSLIEQGAHVNARNRTGYTPLHLAA
jgi:ankyrin repeat protein